MLWLFLSILFAQEPLAEPPLGEVLSAAEQQQLVYETAKILRCPTCQGVSVADSGADGAKAMKARISELVSLGYTSDQILDYFVSKYGEWILLRPTEEHYFLWMAPVFFLLMGGGVIVLRKRGSQENQSQPIPLCEVTTYRESILKELDGD